MRARLRRASHWSAGFGLAMLVLAGALLYLLHQREQEQQAGRQSLQADLALQEVLQGTVDIETAIRGTLLSGNPAFLDPAHRAMRSLGQRLERLRALASTPGQLAQLGTLESLVRQRTEHSWQVLARHSASDPAQQARLTSEGRRLQDAVRDRVEDMRRAGRAELAQHDERSARAYNLLRVAILLAAVVLWGLSLLWVRARARLRRTRGNYRQLFDSAANGMALVDAGGRIVRTNDSYCAMLGYARGELDGKEFASLKHPDERAHTAQVLDQLLRDSTPTIRNERRYLSRHHAVVWVRSTLSRMDAAEGGAPMVLVVAEDVSARVRQEELLRRSEVLLQNASRMAAVDGWYLTLPDGALTLGGHALRMLGLENEAPRRLLARLEPGSRRALLSALSACRREGSSFDIELESSGADGRILGLRVMGQPVLRHGRVAGIEGALHDITEVRLGQLALRHSEQRFRAAAQVTNDGIWDLDVATGRIWRSPSIARLLGLAPEDLPDDLDAWRRLIHPDDRALVQAGMEQALRGADDEMLLEYRVMRTDGSYAVVSDRSRVLRDGHGAALRVVGGVRDLTERRRTQQAFMEMAATVPSGEPQAFFAALLRHMLQALGADSGGISRPRPDNPRQVRTMAAMADGEQIAGFDYDLGSSPCAALEFEREHVVPDALELSCPAAAAASGARAYVGRRLEAADGTPLGFIYALFRQPIADLEMVGPVLRIFEARASAELERIETAIRLREQAALIDHASEAIVVLGLDLRIRSWNRGAQSLYQWPPEQALGEPVLSCYLDEAAARAALAAVLSEHAWHGETRQRRRDGSELTVEEGWTLLLNDAGEPHSILKIGSDISDKKAVEEQIRRLAYYDALTGLPNRRLFTDRLEQLRLGCARSGRNGALLFIDMDNFKTLNDRHGHDMGDEFLRCTAARLSACVRADDTVARLGGDEFVVLLDNLDPDPALAVEQAGAVGANIVAAFREPVMLGSLSHRSTASIGLVLVQNAEGSVDDLLCQADQAMYRAKKGGRNAVCVAAPELAGAATLEAEELDSALAQGQFELWLEPQAGPDGELAGAAASLRWHHPQRHLLAPADFFPLAERCGHMVDIGDWLLRQSCARLAAWQAAPATRRLRLAVPVSSQQLRDRAFADKVLAEVAASAIEAGALVLELPGSAFDTDESMDDIARLRSAGVRVAACGFGAGSIALDRVRRLQADEIKFASIFVRDARQQSAEGAIVAAVAALGRTLQLRLVAEGVDDAAQKEFLATRGVQVFQGPWAGAPVPADRFGAAAARESLIGAD